MTIFSLFFFFWQFFFFSLSCQGSNQVKHAFKESFFGKESLWITMTHRYSWLNFRHTIVSGPISSPMSISFYHASSFLPPSLPLCWHFSTHHCFSFSFPDYHFSFSPHSIENIWRLILMLPISIEFGHLLFLYCFFISYLRDHSVFLPLLLTHVLHSQFIAISFIFLIATKIIKRLRCVCN